MLEALGVVEIRRGLCTVISENPEQGYLNVFLSHLYLLSGSAEELRDFRKIIEEAYTTQAIATATKEDISAIRDALDQFRAHCRAGTLTVDDDLHFHNQILQATHNAFLISMGTALNTLFRESIGASIRKFPEVALADHEKIFAGILQRRAELAAEAIEESADRWSLSLPQIESTLL